MLRQGIFVLGWIVAAATGFWIQQLQHENASLREKIKATHEARVQAEAETRRVYDMYEHERSLVHSEAPPPQAPKPPLPPAAKAKADPQALHAAQKRVDELTDRLHRLDSDNHVVDQRSQTYRQQQDTRAESTKTDLVTRLHVIGDTSKALQDQIVELRGQPKSSDRKAAMQNLEEQRRGLAREREQIDAQLKATNTQERTTDAAIHQEVVTEKTEIANERSSLQHDLDTARAELARLRSGH